MKTARRLAGRRNLSRVPCELLALCAVVAYLVFLTKSGRPEREDTITIHPNSTVSSFKVSNTHRFVLSGGVIAVSSTVHQRQIRGAALGWGCGRAEMAGLALLEI